MEIITKPLLGKLVVLRPHRLEDMPVYHRWLSDVEVNSLTLLDPSPRSMAKTRQLLSRWMSDPGTHSFAIHLVDTDELVGWCTLLGFPGSNKSAEMSIRIAEKKNWDKNYGTDASIVLLRYGFEELKLQKVDLNVFSFNRRAIRCYLKVGFEVEDVLPGRGKRNGEDWQTAIMTITAKRFFEIYGE